MQRVSLGFSGEWRDLLGDVENAIGTSALTLEAYADGTNTSPMLMRFWHATQDDTLYFKFQLDHWVDLLGQIRFHAHLIPMSLPVAGVSDIVRFKYDYVFAPVNANVPRSGWATNTINYTVPAADQYEHVVVPIFTANIPANTPASSFVLIRLMRPGATDAADTYSVDKAGPGTGRANLAILGADCHAQASRAGTQGEFS
jgi:hypothetical protein